MPRLLIALGSVSLFHMMLVVTPAFSAQPIFVDPLDATAVQKADPQLEPLIAITSAGDKFVAVGARGMIIVGDTTGRKWHQASVPVQSDLVAAQLLDSQEGWAVGHDGVILHSDNGGSSWSRELDGRTARLMLEDYYKSKIGSGDIGLNADLQELQLNFDAGPVLPWLGVCFVNPKTGFVVGPFGNIARTDDGGKTWVPWLDRVDNPNFYDLNAIGKVGNDIYIVGEQGTVYVFDRVQQKFIARPTSYQGDLFGLVGDERTLIVYGLRGHIFRSVDQGKTWVAAANSSNSSIMGGAILPGGHIVLVTVDGSILVSTDGGVSFRPTESPQNAALTDVIAAGNELLITSLNGIRGAPGA